MPKTSVEAAGEAMPASKVTFDWHPDQLPETYAMQAEGKCMEPLFRHGQKLMFSRSAPWRSGDVVVLFKRPEVIQPGEHQAIVKRLVLTPGRTFWTDPANHKRGNLAPIVIVEMLNPRKILYIDPAHLLGIHKCLGPVPEGQHTVKRDHAWVMQQAHMRAILEA
jgi:hypothetical protein